MCATLAKHFPVLPAHGLRRTGTVALMVLLSACGSLPSIGQKPPVIDKPVIDKSALPTAPALPDAPAAPALPTLPSVPAAPAGGRGQPAARAPAGSRQPGGTQPAAPAPAGGASPSAGGSPPSPGAAPAQPTVAAAPRVIEVSVQAEKTLNTDSRNRTAPLVVRIYTLKAPAGFQSADFFALFDRDQTLLAADLLSREEIQMQPGETRRLQIDAKGDARVVGVMGAFRELERATWRAVYLLPPVSDAGGRASAKAVTLPVKVSLGAREVRVSAP